MTLFSRLALIILGLLFLSGCVTDGSYTVTGPESQGEPEQQANSKESVTQESQSARGEPTALALKEGKETIVSPSEPGPAEKSPATAERSEQEILDTALEFCQASYDFWERGELENALDALDQAYSLILQVNPEQNPEILQQRDDLRFTISKRIMECYTSRFTVANGNHKAIPLVMNVHVKRALDQFKGREKPFFLRAYKRSGKYRPYIVKELKEAGLPEELSWLPLIESGFTVRALSRARALGLWQFIASTGYKFGLKRDQWVDERMDPVKSTQAAIAYLKELHQIFGDWTTVLAAYNCGEGNVLRSIRTQKINYLDNFWDLYGKLPSETAFYVPKFLAVLHILHDPEAHGFTTLPPVEREIQKEEVAINKQLHLKTIATHMKLPYKELKDLNPELRRYSTPNRPYALNMPPGTGQLLMAKLDKLPAWKPPSSTYVVHRVRSGETLSVIARRYRTSVRSIMAANGLKSSNYLKVGWKLKIRARGGYVPPKRTYSAQAGSRSQGETVNYVVRKGDSLWTIANRYGTTIKAIQSKNGLRNTHLHVGQVLVIPGRSTVFATMKTKSYKVVGGDSPYMIASRHRMSLSEFLRLNDLTPRSTIYPGQTLLVKAE